MTELVYVPRRIMKEWLKKNWGIVGPYPAKSDWAVLMHPPGWVDPTKRPTEEKAEEDNG